MFESSIPSPSPADERRRLRFEVSGVVQGVGFRPGVYRLATSLGLGGWVRNDAAGVVIEVEGPARAVQAFRERLPAEAPPLAEIERCRVADRPLAGTAGFEIRTSRRDERPSALVSPDTATCDDCLRELRDPADRRHRYPFINCTNCGPRFSIVRSIPYDRPFTTMAGFDMCGPCRAEYEDPLDRRFHAQPNACPDCGPSAALLDRAGAVVVPADGAGGARPVERAGALLADGAIAAVKGLGGYHLACDATDEEAVSRLRRRKHREDKPFAVMVADAAAAGALVHLSDSERALLESRARPIVLARRRRGDGLARDVAPGHRDLGLMLPYTPLHHLLLADAGRPLVMTSGNVSDEPIAYRDQDALERLSRIADCFLVHDRPIHTRTDDSVVRVVDVAGERRPLFLRRSRGYVPSPLRFAAPAGGPLIACGAHLKNTFTIAAGSRAWVSHHIGDLENWETLRALEDGASHFEALFEVRPAAIACDLHPDYLSTGYGRRRAAAKGLPVQHVQHHHAHLAACLGEQLVQGGGDDRPVDASRPDAPPPGRQALGLIFDGTGYGPDGTVWGGELLAGGLGEFERAGHLWPVRLPGGEAAIRRPWRMACAWLCALEPDVVPAVPRRLAGHVKPADWEAAARLARSGFASPVTTSVGRLFDAVAALCGFGAEVTYEGQAAIGLEMAAAESGVRPSFGAEDTAADMEDDAYPFPAVPGETGLLLDARPLVGAVLRDLEDDVPPGVVARRFHHGLADGSAIAAAMEASRRGLRDVVLSGGVFQNVILLERTAARLAAAGLRPLVPRRLPPNDGGISYGQALVAAAVVSAPSRSGEDDSRGGRTAFET